MPAPPAPVIAYAIVFESAAAADRLVAGIPAAARALATLDRAGITDAGVAVAGGWQPGPLCKKEARRLAPCLAWQPVDIAEPVGTERRWIGGAELQLPVSSVAELAHADLAGVQPADDASLRAASRAVIAATGKAGDGIVSRHLNRPVSQAITGLVLRWPGARPWHATLAAGLIGAAMLLALVLGGSTGLLAGAVLFQLASIVDGVDGEIARATFRSSARGAMLDSVTDALTNLGFIGGVSYNLYAAGHLAGAMAGAAGCAVLAVGMTLLGLQSRRDGGDFTFDALKHRFRARPTRLKQWLTWLAMRDFYALAACVLILAGAAVPLMFAFGVVAAGWLAVVLWTLVLPRTGSRRADRRG